MAFIRYVNIILLTIYRILLVFRKDWIFPPDVFSSSPSIPHIQSDTHNPLTTMTYGLFARLFPHGRHLLDGTADIIRLNDPKKFFTGFVQAHQETINHAH